MTTEEHLAKLRESIPKVRQFLTDSSRKTADPELRERILKVVAGLDENFSRAESELPELIADLNARKAKAESAMQKGMAELKSLQDGLAAKAEAAKAQLLAEKARLAKRLPVTATGADDPELGRKLRNGLLRCYVSEAPAGPQDTKSPSFEDWADSVVNLTIPPAVDPTKTTASPSGPTIGLPPNSFESWLNVGDGSDSKSDDSRTLSAKEIEKRRQDVLDYYRKGDQ